MSDTDPNRKEAAGRAGLKGQRSGFGAALLALIALAAVAVALFWMTRKAPQTAGLDAGLGAEHGVMVIGVSVFVTALIAHIRNMDASDVLDMLGALLMALVSIIGAILKGIWDWFLGLIGLD